MNYAKLQFSIEFNVENAHSSLDLLRKEIDFVPKLISFIDFFH